MELVTIPFGYEGLSPARQAEIVPICVSANDKQGKPIEWGWFEAAARIHEPLLGLAKTFLNDIWRASEITEAAIYSVWYKHGNNLGFHASSRVYAAARWHALDRKAGCWHSRRGLLQSFEDLEEVVRKRVLVDPENYARQYEEELYFKRLYSELESEGLDEVCQMFKLLQDGCRWHEIGIRLGKRPDAARMRFERWTRKLLGHLRRDHV
jgi:hypothetical protein